MSRPAAGWTTPARLARVIDGDTVEVIVERNFVVRLLDCWAPETRTRDPVEKLAGLESRDNLIELLEGQQIVLVVPAETNSFDDRFSFGRVLGRIHTDAGDVSELQIAAGHATETKQARK